MHKLHKIIVSALPLGLCMALAQESVSTVFTVHNCPKSNTPFSVYAIVTESGLVAAEGATPVEALQQYAQLQTQLLERIKQENCAGALGAIFEHIDEDNLRGTVHYTAYQYGQTDSEGVGEDIPVDPENPDNSAKSPEQILAALSEAAAKIGVKMEFVKM